MRGMKTAVASIALIAGLVTSQIAPPGRAPSAAERHAINTATHRYPGLSGIPPSMYRVTHVRVSRADRQFAFARLDPTGQWTDPAQVELVLDRSGWTVDTLGTAEVGCDAPPTVRAEFHVVCPAA
jgi:hypothetical protein